MSAPFEYTLKPPCLQGIRAAGARTYWWVWGLAMWSPFEQALHPVYACRGPHLLVGAGQTAHVHDLGSGAPLRRYDPQEGGGSALASMQVEGTRDGRLLFAGAPSASSLRRHTANWRCAFLCETLNPQRERFLAFRATSLRKDGDTGLL